MEMKDSRLSMHKGITNRLTGSSGGAEKAGQTLKLQFPSRHQVRSVISG